MTRKMTLWLIFAIGIIAIIGATMLFHNGIEEKTHDGARFVMADACF